MERSRATRFLLVLALVGLVNLPNLLYPLFEDTALFMAVGNFMRDGLVPYRDLVLQKPPGIFVVTWLTAVTVGTSDLAFRLVELPVVVAFALACGRIVRATELRGAWFIGCVVAGILSSTRLWGLPDRGQVEFFQLAAAAWSVALVLEHVTRSRAADACSGVDHRLLSAGVLVGIACWLKPQAAVFGVLLAGVVVSVESPRASRLERGRPRVRSVLWLGLGVAGVSAPICIWLLQSGAFGSFVEQVLAGNAAYVSRAPPRGWAELSTRSFLPDFGAVPGVLASLGAVTMVLRSRNHAPTRRLAALVIVWWLAAGIQMMTGAYLFGYHRVVHLGVLSVLVANGICGSGALVARGASDAVRRFGRAAVEIAGLLVLLAHPRVVVLQLLFWQVALTGRPLGEVHDGLGALEPFFDHGQQDRAATYVRRRCAADESVQVLGRAGVFWLRADRRPATEFLITNQVHRASGSSAHDSFVERLTRSSPCYVLLRRRDVFSWFGYPGSEHLVSQDRVLSEWLASRYELEETIGGDLMLFRRR